MNETGKTIQELRINAGFTQKELAKALHITDKAVSKWERGICLPDVGLLPKLSLLLDTDVEVLVSKSIEREKWIGLIDIDDCDFSQVVYDKPLVYYLLIHYLLLGINKIHVMTNNKNKQFLQSGTFNILGLDFSFETPTAQNVMIINHPWFLFGSDLTQQFQGAMVSERNTKLVPENQEAVVYFAHGNNGYFEDEKKFIRNAYKRTLGRGMVCLDMGDYDKVLDVAAFVRTYQKNSRLLIGSIEEVAYRKGIITEVQLRQIADDVPYGSLLQEASKPQVG